jgi:leader peptidase (prepilin peptidase)/N-methyltransferase
MAFDLVPLLSYLMRGRRCKYCSKPISSRYFWVELLTGVLFVVLYFHFRHDAANAVALLLFGAVLVPVFCIDLERFEIPNQLNLFVFVIAIARDAYGIATHEHGHELIWHCLPASILGAFVGVALFGSIRVIGWIWKRQEAMGLGDVALARGMGAMLVSVVPAGADPLRLIPIWVLGRCSFGIGTRGNPYGPVPGREEGTGNRRRRPIKI